MVSISKQTRCPAQLLMGNLKDMVVMGLFMTSSRLSEPSLYQMPCLTNCLCSACSEWLIHIPSALTIAIIACQHRSP